MTDNKNDKQKPSGGIFRVFEFIAEAIGWLGIVASPFLIGLVVGAVIYFRNPTTVRFIIAILISVVALVIGIVLATRKWKTGGTVAFLSRVSATPELDDNDSSK